MGVTDEGRSFDVIMPRRPDAHPFAVAPIEVGEGIWQIRVKPTPIGCVLKRALDGTHVYDVYAHCRDENGKRPD